MITCKEDLLNTFIINDKGSLRDAYLCKLKEFGFEWYHQSGKPTQNHLNAFEILVNTDNKIDWNVRVNDGKVSRKQLTLSDFKPARTEYVKVIGSIFKLKAELEAGELYHEILGSSELVVIDDESVLIYELQNENVYRKREITWQDEVEEYLLTCNSGCGMFDIQYGNGNQLSLADEDFLEAARIALKVLGELK